MTDIKINRALRVGSRINNSTSGNVLFSDSDFKIAQNNNLFWDDTNNRLGIGTDSPSGVLTISASGEPAIDFTRKCLNCSY